MKDLIRSVLGLNKKTILISLKEVERIIGGDFKNSTGLDFIVANLKNLDEMNEIILRENRIEVEELKLEISKVKDSLKALDEFKNNKLEVKELLEVLKNIRDKKVEIKKVDENKKTDLEEIFKMLRRDLVNDSVHIDMNELAEFEETEDALMFCNKILDPYLNRYFKDGIFSDNDRDEMKDRIFDIVRG